MDEKTISPSQQAFNNPAYPIPPYLGFDQPTSVSHGTSAALDKLAALFVVVMGLGPLAMAAYGANVGAS